MGSKGPTCACTVWCTWLGVRQVVETPSGEAGVGLSAQMNNFPGDEPLAAFRAATSSAIGTATLFISSIWAGTYLGFHCSGQGPVSLSHALASTFFYMVWALARWWGFIYALTIAFTLCHLIVNDSGKLVLYPLLIIIQMTAVTALNDSSTYSSADWARFALLAGTIAGTTMLVIAFRWILLRRMTKKESPT